MSADEVSDAIKNAISFPDWSPISGVVLKKVAGVAIAILAAPFALWGIWFLIRNWGVWKIHDSNSRPHYIRTWHGWVEAKKYAVKRRKRQIRRANSRSHRFSTSPAAGYSWIFWDPTGEKRITHEHHRRRSILRYLRSFRNRSAARGMTIASSELGTAEEGRNSIHLFCRDAELQSPGLLFTRYQDWPRRRGQDVNAQLSAGSGFGSRVPICRDGEAAYPPEEESNYGQSRLWQVRGHGVTAINCTLPLSSPKLNGTSDESDISSKRGALTLAFGKSPVPRASTSTHGITPRTFSRPVVLSPAKDQRSDRWVSDPSWLESMSSHSIATPLLYPARNPEGPDAPHNSDELHGSGFATPQRRHSRTEWGYVELTTREIFARNLYERLKVWAKPLVLNPYESTGREYGGIGGRSTSPAMGWVVRGEPVIVSSSNVGCESGEDVPIRRRVLSGCSSRSCTSFATCDVWSCAPSGEQRAVSLNPSGSFETCQLSQSTRHKTNGPCCSDSAFQGSYLPGKLNLVSALRPHHQTSDKYARRCFSLSTRCVRVSSLDEIETQPLIPPEKSRIDHGSDVQDMKEHLRLGAGVTQPTISESAPSNVSDFPLT